VSVRPRRAAGSPAHAALPDRVEESNSLALTASVSAQGLAAYLLSWQDNAPCSSIICFPAQAEGLAAGFPRGDAHGRAGCVTASCVRTAARSDARATFSHAAKCSPLPHMASCHIASGRGCCCGSHGKNIHLKCSQYLISSFLSLSNSLSYS